MCNLIDQTDGIPSTLCRSGLAREKLKDTARNQNARVIVDDFREQARSYRGPPSVELTGYKVQAHRVDAITQPRRRRTVREHMPEVRIAFGAGHFGADHAVADVTDLDHRAVGDRRVEAGPAAARIKLGGRIEQRLIAADAVIHTLSLGLIVLTAERTLGALEAAHVVLLWIEHCLPFFNGFLQLFHRYTSATEKA